MPVDDARTIEIVRRELDEHPITAFRDAGVSGIKVFLAYPELGIMWSARGLFELMTAARPGLVGPGGRGLVRGG